jgi:hypothetical protein
MRSELTARLQAKTLRPPALGAGGGEGLGAEGGEGEGAWQQAWEEEEEEGKEEGVAGQDAGGHAAAPSRNTQAAERPDGAGGDGEGRGVPDPQQAAAQRGVQPVAGGSRKVGCSDHGVGPSGRGGGGSAAAAAEGAGEQARGPFLAMGPAPLRVGELRRAVRALAGVRFAQQDWVSSRTR